MKKHLFKGFSLLELLIVIAIFGILAGFLLTNLTGARMRARDSRAKSELESVRQALSLYLNNYNRYPSGAGTGLVINGCGPTGTSSCSGAGKCPTADFAAGGADGCETTFMTKITKTSGGNFYFFRYYTCDSTGETYRLKYSLENKSDSEIQASQARCPACGTTYDSDDYIVCP